MSSGVQLKNAAVSQLTGTASDPKSNASLNQSQANQSLSYSHVAQKVNFPKKEQAIVLDAIDEITIKEYILAIGKIINPSDIRFASRISNNRICLYLADNSIVKTLTKTNTSVNINGHALPIRPLISEYKRVLLSNVCPIISHNAILEKFTEIGINCTSAVSFIKAGISTPGYAHILSFRRQVYIPPEDIIKLPDSIQITYDNTTYWIYVTTDNPVCFLCKKEGHIAKMCSEIIQPELSAPNTTPESDLNCTVKTSADHREPFPKLPEQGNRSETPDHTTEKLTLKRPLTDTSSGNSVSTSLNVGIRTTQVSPTINLEPENFAPPTLPPAKITEKSARPAKKKKITKNSKEDDTNTSILSDKTDCLLLPAKSFLTSHPEDHVLSYDQLKDFLSKAPNNKNIISLASNYTTNFAGLIKMLQKIYPLLTDKSIKNRITRLNKKLILHNNWTNDNDASNLSDEISETQTSDSDSSNITPEEHHEGRKLPLN